MLRTLRRFHHLKVRGQGELSLFMSKSIIAKLLNCQECGAIDSVDEGLHLSIGIFHQNIQMMFLRNFLKFRAFFMTNQVINASPTIFLGFDLLNLILIFGKGLLMISRVIRSFGIGFVKMPLAGFAFSRKQS